MAFALNPAPCKNTAMIVIPIFFFTQTKLMLSKLSLSSSAISTLLLALLLGACAPKLPLDQAPVQVEPDGQAASTDTAKVDQLNDDAANNNDTGLSEDLLYDLLVANMAMFEQQPELASEAMTRAATRRPEAALLERAARLALNADQFGEAIELGQQWVKSVPDDYLAYMITALAALSNEQNALAVNMLQQQVDLQPDDLDYGYERAGEYLMQHPAGLKSLSTVQTLAANRPKQIGAWILVANVAQRVDDLAVQNAAADKILAIDPQHERAAIFKLIALSDGELGPLQTFADAFSAANPTAKHFKIAYGRSLLRRELPEQGQAQLLSILQNDPEDAEVLNLVAMVYHNEKNYSKAVTYFKQLLELQPEDNRARTYMASSLQNLGRFDEAKAVVAQITDDEARFSAQRQIAFLIQETQGIEKSLPYLQSITGSDQQQRIQLIIDHNLMLQEDKQLTEANTVLTKGLTQYPDSSELRYQRALLAVELEQMQNHEADMRLLLQQDPNNAHYHNTLGYSLLVDKQAQARLAEAQVLINKAHELAPDDPYILDSKGWLEFKLGNLESALLYLSQAFELDEDPEIAAHLGEVYWLQGEQEKAKKLWLDAQEADQENKSLNETIKRFLP